MEDHDFRQLIEQSYQLQELTRHPGWAMLLDLVQQETKSKRHRMFNGQIDNHEEYLKVAGELVGAQSVFDAPARIAQFVERERVRRGEVVEVPVE